MEEYIQYHQIRTGSPLSEDLKKACLALIDSGNGILTISFSPNRITIGYSPYQTRPTTLEKQISDLGTDLKCETEKRGYLKRLLHNMAQSNKQNMGSRRLDCCHLND